MNVPACGASHLARGLLSLMVASCGLDGQSPRGAFSSQPATGYYRISAKTISDTCGYGYVAPGETVGLVMSSTVLTHANPLMDIPFTNIPHGITMPHGDWAKEPRVRIVTEPLVWTEYTTKNSRLCERYVVTRRFEIVAMLPDAFGVVVDVNYGDGDACDQRQPARCQVKVQYEYLLEKALCAPACTRGGRLLSPEVSPKTPEVICRCN